MRIAKTLSGRFARAFAWAKGVFAPANLAGDARSAVIATLVTLAWAAVFTHVPQLTFVVGVNADGYGQPRALFDLAEKEDTKLRLKFTPANLRDTYVCEFKRATGFSWEAMVMDYLDTYRECFDVARHGENSFAIYPNKRSGRLSQKQGSFLCKCME